jgi:hypothetical protein
MANGGIIGPVNNPGNTTQNALVTTVTGSTTFTAQAKTETVTAFIVAGGGGGGGAQVGGGGGAGGYRKLDSFSLAPDKTATITIGGGGADGSPQGVAGSPTSITDVPSPAVASGGGFAGTYLGPMSSPGGPGGSGGGGGTGGSSGGSGNAGGFPTPEGNSGGNGNPNNNFSGTGGGGAAAGNPGPAPGGAGVNISPFIPAPLQPGLYNSGWYAGGGGCSSYFSTATPGGQGGGGGGLSNQGPGPGSAGGPTAPVPGAVQVGLVNSGGGGGGGGTGGSGVVVIFEPEVLTFAASGVWSLMEAYEAKKNGNWSGS